MTEEEMLKEMEEFDELCSSILKNVEGLPEDEAVGTLSSCILKFAGPNNDIIKAIIHDLSYVIGDVNEPRKKWVNPDDGFSKIETLA